MSKQKENKNFNNPFAATLAGIRGSFGQKSDKQLKTGETLEGKVCLITGANSGLGFATAVEMAKLSGELILAIRSKLDETVEKVKAKSGKTNVRAEKVELSDPSSILDLVDRLANQGVQLDVLVCNAGVVSRGGQATENGLDLMFAVNYLAKFILVNALLEKQVIVPGSAAFPRLIFVSSESHRVEVPLQEENFGKAKTYSMGKTIKEYGYTKKLLNMFVTELNQRWKEKEQPLNTYTLCPGAVRSNIARSAPTIVKPLLAVAFRIFFKSPAKASKPVLYLAASQEVEHPSNLYYHMMQEKRMDEAVYEAEQGKLLWELSEKLLKQLLTEVSS